MKAPWAALIGHPVEHSFSPFIYRAFAYALNRPIHYRALNVRERKLGNAISSAAKRSWLGWNVTLPHKVAILKYLDEIHADAEEAGAVNLVRFKEGRSHGYNTDIEGFLAPLAQRGITLKGRTVLVLGAGGAARAVGAACTRKDVEEIVFLNRHPDKAAALAALFGGRAGGLDERILHQEIRGADVLVNATSLGMDGTANPVPFRLRLKKNAVAYDLVYRPRVTPFLKTAADGGAQTIGGLEMLVAQAGAAWKIWFSEEVPQPVLTHVQDELERRIDEPT